MSEPSPLISVVTPSYNQGAFLAETIESVLAQNYPHFEHIVIDGGSTDNTIEVLRRFPHVTWVSEKDHGQSEALNKGFRIAKGEIVAWINSDDTYLPGAFHAVSRALGQSKGVHVVYGKHYVVDRHGRHIRTVTPLAISFETLLCYWMPRSAPGQPATFFLREVFDSVGLLDENLHFVMDREFFLRLAQRYDFHFIDQALATYRIHTASKSSLEWMTCFLPEMRRVCLPYFKRRGPVQYLSALGHDWVSVMRGYLEFWRWGMRRIVEKALQR